MSLPANLLDVIEAGYHTAPRTLQKRLGPSEIGTPCEHCLVAKMAGWEPVNKKFSWPSVVGTSVHSWLATHFAFDDRYRVEHRVDVGELGGQTISGSADLYDTVEGRVIDWKVIGVASMRNVRANGPKVTYRRQAHLYARGFAAQGYDVREVAIAFLPRSALDLSGATYWTEPYNPQVAVDAMVRANRLLATLETLTEHAPDKVEEWIGGLTRDPYDDGGECFDCSTFADWVPEAPPTLDDLMGAR